MTKYRHNEPLLLFNMATRDTFRRAALSESTVFGLITAHRRPIAGRLDEEGTS
jgi:hypothetical protein